MQAEAAALAAAAPLVELAAAGLQRVGLQLLPLHRATAKLGHIVTSLLAGLVQEGFCTPPDAADGAHSTAELHYGPVLLKHCCYITFSECYIIHCMPKIDG